MYRRNSGGYICYLCRMLCNLWYRALLAAQERDPEERYGIFMFDISLLNVTSF